MIEGSGSESIPLTNGSGSGSRGPKNMWIRWIRIRNTGLFSESLVGYLDREEGEPRRQPGARRTAGRSTRPPSVWSARTGCSCSLQARTDDPYLFPSTCFKLGVVYGYMQCCESVSGLRNPVPFWPLDPGSGIRGWVKNQDPDPGWTTRIIFRELGNNFMG